MFPVFASGRVLNLYWRGAEKRVASVPLVLPVD